MGFLSLEYAVFLGCLTLVFWLIPHLQARLLLLLTASLFFYSSIQVQYVWLLLASTGVNYALGWQIRRRKAPYRLLLLIIGIVLNLLLLLGFKYVPFLAGVASNLGGWEEGNTLAVWAAESIVAPISVSFFAFEMISYLVDIYRGAPPARDFLNFAVYKTFFAKLLSGPIVRYQEFCGQLQSHAKPLPAHWVNGLWLIACGALKKGIVADNLARFVDLTFNNVERAGSADLWLALVGYGLQIYFDFSGYIDVARGSALLLGFKLPQNFDFPYFAASISDFWRRWHITLGHWLRDYLYIPLGGSRQGLLITCGNLCTVMLVAGIWHGANWGFIIWGMWHGLALVGHRLVMVAGKALPALAAFWPTLPGIVVATLVTQFVVLVSWIPFRLPHLLDTQMFLQRMWGSAADPQFGLKVYVETLGLAPGQIALLMALLLVATFAAYRCDRARWQLTWQAKLFLAPICLYLVGLFGAQGTVPFIYFDF